MRELMKLLDPKAANRLQWMLTEAGIASELTTELSNAYTGAMLAVVWVQEDADERTMKDVRTRFGEWVAATQSGGGATERTRCAGCGYDLRGQVEDGRCPECGRPYTLKQERPCPYCNEMNPVDFEVCWKCGADLTGAKAAE
jgi:hypothetical protein